ncbi:MAG: PaaI family thioesterase, partial [Anaerolineales bacterium]|nr:PaaI family thioesterase [Anaerolineales bacterium]
VTIALHFAGGRWTMDFSGWPPEIAARMGELLAGGALQIPPPVFVEMGGEIVAWDMAAKSLAVRFPVQARFQNPMGYMQGGMIAAAVDNVVGPLSFMVAPPSVTRSLTMEYLRPIPPSLAEFTVVARLVAAEVRRGPGTLLAKATLHNRILRRFGG